MKEELKYALGTGVKILIYGAVWLFFIYSSARLNFVAWQTVLVTLLIPAYYLFFKAHLSLRDKRERELVRKGLTKDRIVILSGHMDEESCREVLEKMLYLDSAGSAPIKLCINSHGGLAAALHSLVSGFPSLKSEVIGIVIGEAQSAAAGLLQACNKRYAFPGTEIMFHEVRQHFSEEITLMTSNIDDYVRYLLGIKKSLAEHQNFYNDLIMRKSGINQETLRKIDGVELSPEEALKLNLIDAIVTKI